MNSLQNLKRMIDGFEKLTVSEQQALYQILRSDYEALESAERQQNQKQHQIVETLKLFRACDQRCFPWLVVYAHVKEIVRNEEPWKRSENLPGFTVTSLTEAVHTLYKTDVKYITVNRIIDSLVRQNVLYVAQGLNVQGDTLTYGFVDLLKGETPPTLNDRRRAAGKTIVKDGDISDSERAANKLEKRNANQTKRRAEPTAKLDLSPFRPTIPDVGLREGRSQQELKKRSE